MFTFGRDHEKMCAARYVHNAHEIWRIHEVIDAVHDLIEGSIKEEDIVPILSCAIAEGGSGIWEQTITWIRKLTKHYSSVANVWPELAKHHSYRVRTRIAIALPDMPYEMARTIGVLLKSDMNKQVREAADLNWNRLQ